MSRLLVYALASLAMTLATAGSGKAQIFQPYWGWPNAGPAFPDYQPWVYPMTPWYAPPITLEVQRFRPPQKIWPPPSEPPLARPWIHPRNRVPNRTGVQCVWASLETIARHHQMPGLYDLTTSFTGPAYPAQVEGVLRARGVTYRLQEPGNPSLKLLRSACAAGLPCVVGIDTGNPHCWHALVCTAITREGYCILDSSSPWQETVWSPDRFADAFTGFTLVIFPPEQE